MTTENPNNEAVIDTATEPVPEPKPQPKADPQLLEHIARVYHTAERGELQVLAVLCIDKSGKLTRVAMTDRQFTSECMLVTFLERMRQGVTMDMERRDMQAMAEQQLAEQRAAAEALEQASDDSPQPDINDAEPAGNA